MKAVQINNYGGSQVVEINENAPKPAVSQGHLLIEVHAAGVNPIDWKIREGYMSQMVPLKLPATLGGDFSGIVAEVGKSVPGFKKGDEIYVRSFRVLKRGGIIVSMLEQPDTDLMEQYGVHVEKTFPLEQAGDALEYQKGGHPRGKVVLKIRED